MSFRINTNTDAMSALNNLNTVSTQLSQSITRLSTGLKINSAADDPAGLIISENFKAQIGGITQAISNSQQAINYTKTADGALSEVNALLDSARTLAVSSANSATQDTNALQANQSQLKSIVASITRIAQTTQYGKKTLLNGSAGNASAVTDNQDIASISIGNNFNNVALNASSTVTLTSLTAATQASVTGATFASAAATVANTGSFSINGTTFNVSANTTVTDVLNMVNGATSQTGVIASYDGTSGGALTFTSSIYGSKGQVNVVDSAGTALAAAGVGTVTAGTDATASIMVGGVGVQFTGGQNGNSGLTLSDSDGNKVILTTGGNKAVSTPAAIGQVESGSSQFQIGANANQTAILSLGNYASTQLGSGVVNGLTMDNLDLTSTTGANDAIKVIDKAITDITTARGNIGNFQTNVLSANVATLSTAQQNLSASESTIADVDVASEMTSYTKEQILVSAGMSVLAQANSAPQAVLKLLGG